jgi:glycosyltransferase involved in cell wall biosynthesis
MIKPLFSVIITAYNYGRFLAESIDSVLGQTLPRDQIEIIVVDDGSTDNTREIAQTYSDKGQIKYILKSNGGHASSLNEGYVHSTGQIIALLDADDVWLPQKLQTIKNIYDSFSCDAVFHNVGKFTHDSDVLVPYVPTSHLNWMEKISDSLYRTNREKNAENLKYLMILSGMTFSRKISDQLFPLPIEFIRHTDYYLSFITYIYADVFFETSILTKYRIHPQSHVASLRSHNMTFMELQKELNQATISELHKRAGSSTPPGLKNITNDSIEIQAELLLVKKGRLATISFIKEKFKKGEYKVSRYDFLRKTLSLCAPPFIFSSVMFLYRLFGLKHLRKSLQKTPHSTR